MERKQVGQGQDKAESKSDPVRARPEQEDLSEALPHAYQVDVSSDYRAQEAVNIFYGIMPTGWEASLVQDMQVFRRGGSNVEFQFELRNGPFWMLVDPATLRASASGEPRSGSGDKQKYLALANLVHNDHLDDPDHYEEQLPLRAAYRVKVSDNDYAHSTVSVTFDAEHASENDRQSAVSRLIERFLEAVPPEEASPERRQRAENWRDDFAGIEDVMRAAGERYKANEDANEHHRWSFLRGEIENEVRQLIGRISSGRISVSEDESIPILAARTLDWEQNAVAVQTLLPRPADGGGAATYVEAEIAFQIGFDGQELKARHLWITTKDDEF